MAGELAGHGALLLLVECKRAGRVRYCKRPSIPDRRLQVEVLLSDLDSMDDFGPVKVAES